MPDVPDSSPRRRMPLLRRILTANPWIKESGKRALARLVRLAARKGSVRPYRRPPALDPAAILARTEEYNQAAERYFAESADPEFLLAKPFSDPVHFPQSLFALGILFHSLRLSPGDVVLELGAGTCWVSHFLNRFGCKTIAVDVSPTALSLGRTYFERDAHTRWDLEPEFLTYDGHRLPLPDASCDRIVINDAFHHLPNPQEILHEMARVLVDGGIVAMSEPGIGHSETADAVREVETAGVLENEVVLEELDEMARAAGFSGAFLLPLSLDAAREVPVSDLLTGKESDLFLAEAWIAFHAGTRYLVLHKGPWIPTSRRAEGLAAAIEVLEPRPPWRIAPGRELSLRVRLRNRGTARWLASADDRRGWTRLGVHLYEGAPGGRAEPLDFDWLRVPLGPDVEPGEAREVELTLPALEAEGDYRLVFDLVAEEVAWFAHLGSPTLESTLRVAGE